MNHDEFIVRMAKEGYSARGAEDLVWISSSIDNPVLTGRPYNIVAVGDGVNEILVPSDRGGYLTVNHPSGEPFRGSLGDAYELVCREVIEADRRWSNRSP